MNKEQIKFIRRIPPVLASFIASLVSVFIILGEFKSFVTYDLMLGVVGAITGVAVAYILVRLKEATNSPKIFISYAHEDHEFAEKLYRELYSTPYIVLMDKHEIHVGDNIKEKLEGLMEASDYIVFVGSKNSSESDWAIAEIDKARKLKKKILPLKIDDKGVPDLLKDTMYADFSGSFEEGIFELIRALKVTRHNKAIQPTAKRGG